ncbi:MAG: hypothetical protein U1E62_05485 [Alsobacter sp.]
MTTALDLMKQPGRDDSANPPVRYIVPGQQEVKRVLLAFGRAGAGKTIAGTASLRKTFYCDQHVVEKRA